MIRETGLPKPKVWFWRYHVWSACRTVSRKETGPKVRWAFVSLCIDDRWSHKVRPLREINRRSEGQGRERWHCRRRQGRRTQERDWCQGCHCSREAKNFKKETECGQCPGGYRRSQDTPEKRWVKRLEDIRPSTQWPPTREGPNTKAPFGTRGCSQRPPHSTVGCSTVPSFLQGLSISSKDNMNDWSRGSRKNSMSWILFTALPQIMLLPFNFVFKRDGSKTYHHFYVNSICKRWPLCLDSWTIPI